MRLLNKTIRLIMAVCIFVTMASVNVLAIPTNEICFIDFDDFAVDEPAFADGLGVKYNDATIGATRLDYLAGGTNPIYIVDVKGNPAPKFQVVNQAMKLLLGKTIDLSDDSSEDDFVYEMDFCANAAHARMKIDFLDSEGNIPFSLTAGGATFQVPGDFGGGGEYNKYNTSSTMQRLKFLFKRNSDSVIVTLNGTEISITQPPSDGSLKKGDVPKLHRAAGLSKISAVKIYKNSTSSSGPDTCFYVDNIKAYESSDDSKPKSGVISFDDSNKMGFKNPVDSSDENIYLFESKDRSYIYGNVTILNGKLSNYDGVLGYNSPTLITNDPLNENNRCMALAGSSGAIVTFQLAEKFILSDELGQDLVFEYDFYSPGRSSSTISAIDTSSTAFAIGNHRDDTWLINNGISDANMTYSVNPQGLAGNFHYNYNGWHKYKLVLKGSNKKADLYIDGVLAVMDVSATETSLADGEVAISSIRIGGRGKSGSGLSYFDNINIYLQPSQEQQEELRISKPYLLVNSSYSQTSKLLKDSVNYYACLNIEAADASEYAPKNYILILAHYDKDGKLIAISSKSVSLNSPEPAHVTTPAYGPIKTNEGDRMKIFLWDKLNFAEPVLEAPIVFSR